MGRKEVPKVLVCGVFPIVICSTIGNSIFWYLVYARYFSLVLLFLLEILLSLYDEGFSSDCRIRFVVVVISGRGIKLTLGRDVMIRTASVPSGEHSLKCL